MEEAIKFVRDTGLVGLLVAILWGFRQGWWYWGREFDALKKDRDEWKEHALKNMNTVTKAVDIAEKK